jgi:serine/threonine protein kinase
VAERNYGGWEIIDPLGSGGQSDVSLVRSPERVQQRKNCLKVIGKTLMASPVHIDQRDEGLGAFAKASWDYARPEEDSELGALKVFKSRRDSQLGMDSQEVQRLKNEIDVLRQNYPGMLKLKAYSESEFWIVTELVREGSLEKQIGKYKGNAGLALKAFRSLVTTVKLLHDKGLVHRDIKPANVFIGKDDELILGDFGIVYVPDTVSRLTVTQEIVGPSDYMAPWLMTGEWVEDVKPCADVYMLGKLLWCLISGKLKLFREQFRRPSYSLAQMFPYNSQIARIDAILEKCLVEEEHLCLKSATELLKVVDQTIHEMGDDRFLPDGNLRLLCIMCGKAKYRPVTVFQGYVKFNLYNAVSSSASSVNLRLFVCDVCGHHVLFTQGYPEEGAKRGWKIPGLLKQP